MDTQDREEQVKKLKRVLEGWRVAVLPLKSIILWEQPWHPAVLVAFTTILHLFIWVLDLNFLTTIAVVGLIINFADFIVPVACNSLISPNSWTGVQEKQFESACKSLVHSYNKIVDYVGSFISLRETSPAMYFLVSLSTLCAITWLSTCISSMFLNYIVVTSLILWPGMQHRGIFNLILSLVNNPKKKVA